MAYTTKYGIAEQVLLRIKGGRPDLATKVDIRDILYAVPQVAAMVMKAGYFSQTLPSGETIPDGFMLATFTRSVDNTGDRSKVELPARPISLPRGMGLWAITDPDNPYYVFIPALPGQIAMVQSQPMLANYGPVAMYEVHGGTVKFDRKISQTTVDVQMFLADIAGVEDTDPLPIPQDYEMEIVDKLFERFVNEPPTNKNNDLFNDNKTQ